uniref:Uncharacterized protein n=1 Tax=Medicago truncatula TaxID=3880 RepID=I3SB09_MEDTR|nr:unknown [Medicago truncatula]
MSLLNTIQSGLSWITAWRKVPGLGLTGSSSLGSVTTQYFPSRPPMAFLPKPIPQSARRFLFCCQLRSQRQQSSIGLPVPHEKNPRSLLSVLFWMCISTIEATSFGLATAARSFNFSACFSLAAIDESLKLGNLCVSVSTLLN